MPVKENYNTRQREIILDYLKQHAASHVTVEEILQDLKMRNHAVGKTTIYRYLEHLCRQGKVRKYFSGNGQSACFQYLDHWQNCPEHYHLMCTECGQLFHIECARLDALKHHCAGEHRFFIDQTKTVFYGLCEQCHQKQLEEAER